jgi:FkbM family methyltransferase
MMKLPNWELLKQLERYKVAADDVMLLPEGGKLRIRNLGIDIDPVRESWLFKYYDFASILVKNKKLAFSRGSDGEINATFGSVTCQVQTAEELFILREILLDGIYDFKLSGDFVICDVGMNVGMTAMYLADRHRMPVVGFELFPPTFAQLEHNLKLNPQLARLIHPSNVGLGKESAVLDLPYLERARGSMGLFTAPQSVESSATGTVRVSIENATQALVRVLERFGNPRIVSKLDCEGAEYGILERWTADDLLKKITLLIIEWHRITPDQDPRDIVELLLKHGFALFVRGSFDSGVGLISAVKVP